MLLLRIYQTLLNRYCTRNGGAFPDVPIPKGATLLLHVLRAIREQVFPKSIQVRDFPLPSSLGEGIPVRFRLNFLVASTYDLYQADVRYPVYRTFQKRVTQLKNMYLMSKFRRAAIATSTVWIVLFALVFATQVVRVKYN
jgi:hypothetical protein